MLRWTLLASLFTVALPAPACTCLMLGTPAQEAQKRVARADEWLLVTRQAVKARHAPHATPPVHRK